MTCETVVHDTVGSVAFFVFRPSDVWLVKKNEILNHFDWINLYWQQKLSPRPSKNASFCWIVECLPFIQFEPTPSDSIRWNAHNKTIILKFKLKKNATLCFMLKWWREQKKSPIFLNCIPMFVACQAMQVVKNNILTIEQIDIYECSCRAILIFLFNINSKPLHFYHMFIQHFKFNIPYQCIQCKFIPLAKFNVTFQKRNWWTKKLISLFIWIQK